MKLNLLSLAPDSFILGPKNILEQFYPTKILDLPCIKKSSHTTQKNFCRKQNNLWGLEIHLTSRCQLSCVRCSYNKRNKDRAELNPKIVEQVLETANKLAVGSIIFSGGGEPLAWSYDNFSQILKENVAYSQAIATNGLGLKRTLNSELLRRLNIVQINVNGYDVASYLTTTRKEQFNLFTQNLTWLFENRVKNITQITGKIVIDNNNYKQIKEYLAFCYQIGFDLVVIKLAGDFESGQNVSLNQQQKKELRELIYSSPVLDFYPAQLDAIATDDNSIDLNLPSKCWVVEYGLYALIRANGDVFPCVASPYTPQNSIGNVNNSSFEEIWESNNHRLIKDKLHDDMAACRCNLGVCRHMRYNFLLDDKLHSSPNVISLPITNKHKPKLL